jgi:hypothetical protein
LNNFEEDCTLNIDINEDFSEWKNPLLIQFKHKKIENYFNYICDVYSSKNELLCYFELKNYRDEQIQGDYILMNIKL